MKNLLIACCLAMVVPCCVCHSKEPERSSLNASVVGGWCDEFDDNVFIVFFPNGTVLFSFVNPPEKPLSEWHQKGTWTEIRPGFVEVSFPKDSSSEKEIYVIHQRFNDVLVSPHGSTLRRIYRSKADESKASK